MENLLIEKLNKKKINFRFKEKENIFKNEDGTNMDISNYKTEIIEEIFDRCVFGKTKWFMYGSGKETYKNRDVYKVKYIFDHEGNEIDTRPSNFQLVKCWQLDIRIRNKLCPIIKK